MLGQTPRNMRVITPSASALPASLNAIYPADDGTIDIANDDGTTLSGVPVVKAAVIPCRMHKITAASVVIYGLYD